MNQQIPPDQPSVDPGAFPRWVVGQARASPSPDHALAWPFPIPTLFAYQDGTMHLLDVVESGRIARAGTRGEAHCGHPIAPLALCYEWPYHPRMCRACWAPACQCCQPKQPLGEK
jgi:hypothetical protein